MNKWKHHTSPLNTKNMYTIIRLSSIIFMMTFILSSCDKDPVDACIDDPTCEYFRCKVNGEWWTPDCEDGPLFGCRHTDLQYYKDLNRGGLEMTSSSKKQNDGFYILLYDFNTINLEKDFRINNVIYSRYFTKDFKFYADTSQSSFIKPLKIDTVNFIIQADFQFMGRDGNGNTVSITEGSFRQKYRF
jgi:hypothetical protein